MIQTGLDCIAALGTEFADPTWSEMDRVVDVTIARERTEIPTGHRGSGWDKNLVGLKKLGIDIKLLRDNGNTEQIALEAAYEAGDDVVLGFFDGPIETVGTTFLKGVFVVTKFQAGEPLEGVATIDMTVKLSARYDGDPEFGVVEEE